jgi:hypothetical protein
MVEKLEGRIPLDIPGHRQECNTKIDHLKETGWEEVDWVHLTQNRDQWQDLANMIIKFCQQNVLLYKCCC